MKRHPGLQALSQHHHFALIQALEIRRAQQQPAAKLDAAARHVAERLLRFWEKTGRQHFREEEEILLPALARHKALDEDKQVMRMLAEHAAIRARIEELREALEAGEPVEKGLAELGRMLNDHVRLEENEIFPRIEATLQEAELAALGQKLTRLHSRKSCEV